MTIIYWPLDTFKNYERHARRFNREAVAKMVRALAEFGFRVPVLATGDGVLVDGHLRLAAAREMKLAKIPAIVVDGLGEARIRALRLALDRSATWAGWDEELLALELADLKAVGEDLTLTGFDVPELDDLLALLNPKPKKDPDDIPDGALAAPVAEGELWALGEHRLFCGDARRVASYDHLLGAALADVVWTDPPYNVNYQGQAGKIMNDHMAPDAFEAFLAEVFGHLHARLADGGPFYVAFSDSETKAFRGGLTSAGFKIASCLIWVKNNIVIGRGDYQWRHEPILYGWKPTGQHRWYGGRARHSVLESEGLVTAPGPDGAVDVVVGDDVLRLRGEGLSVEILPGGVIHVDKPLKSGLHPTTKPVALIERCLRNSSRPGDLALDAFGGSGSTVIACEILGRRARVLELDPKYAGVIARRWEDFTGHKAERLGVFHD